MTFSVRRCHTRAAASSDAGFTLVELMVILAIIAILLGIAITAYAMSTKAATAATCRSNQRLLREADAIARADADTIPDEFDDLAPYVRDFANAHLCPSDGTPLGYDPATGAVTCPNHP